MPQRNSAAAASNPRRKTWIAAGLAGLIALLAGGIYITVRTDQGELVIESEADGVEVTVKRSGQSVKQWQLSRGENRTTVRTGDYEIVITGASADGLQVEDGKFTLTRGSSPVVKITRKAVRVSSKTLVPKELRATGASQPVNWALEFDGKTGQHVAFDPLDVQFKAITVEAHVLPYSIQESCLISESLGVSLRLRNGPGGYDPNLEWTSEAKGRETQWMMRPNNSPPVTRKPIHLAAVWMDKTSRLYVDGKIVYEYYFEGLHELTGTRPWKMGGYPNGESLWHGRIDEVRISNIARYDKEFTPEERFDPDEYTVALYHFDESQGDVLIDSSSNGRHGRIHGAKWVRADSPPPDDTAVAGAAQGSWEPGPDEFALAGLAARPAKLPGIRRWNVDYRVPVNPYTVEFLADGRHVTVFGRRCWRIYRIGDFDLTSFLPRPMWATPVGKGVQCDDNGDRTAFAIDREILIVENGTDRLIKRVRAHDGPIRGLAWSHDGSLLSSVDHVGDRCLKLWSKDGELVRSIAGASYDGRRCAWSPDNELIASARFRDVVVYDVESGERLQRLSVVHNPTCIAWSPDGKWLAVGDKENVDKDVLRVWNTEALDQGHTSLPGHLSGVNHLAWSSDSKFLASAGQDTWVRIWDIESKTNAKKYMHRTEDSNTSVRRLGWSRDGKWLASTDHQNQVYLYDFQAGAIKHRMAGVRDIRPIFDVSGCFTVTLSGGNAAIFSEAGELLSDNAGELDDTLVYFVQLDDGTLEVFKPTEFLAQFGGDR